MQADAESQLIARLTEELKSNSYSQKLVDALCEQMTDDDERVAGHSSSEFFRKIVEPLCDSFAPADVRTYNRLFALVIQNIRTNPKARALDLQLRSFGLSSDKELITRADRLAMEIKAIPQRDEVKRAVILSRVTIGADVAVTSVMIDRLMRFMPEAEIVLIGPSRLRELFGGTSRIRFEAAGYQRSATLIDRLMIWLELLDKIETLSQGLPSGEFLVIDPDSRMTQLGLLPLVKDDRYVFFPSRSFKSESSKPLAALTSEWLNAITNDTAETLPTVSPAPDAVAMGRAIAVALRSSKSDPVVTVNFGVGENSLKRVGEEFESKFLAAMLNRGVRLILDKGAGGDEATRADRALEQTSRLMNRRLRVVGIDENNLSSVAGSGTLDCDVVTWTGGIGMLASLINSSDLYVGYDSAGQHIAAALKVPCIDVFAGAVSQRFRERWSPYGGGPIRVIDAKGKRSRDVLDETMIEAGKLLDGGL